ncbi:fasciclin domain-containing protein, partial [Puteibacter caeruleilacunae]
LPIGLYLESRSADFSLWVEALRESGLYNAFNVAGTYTAFIPDNEAMQAFMSEQGKSSVKDFDKDYLTELVKYHTLNTKFEHTDFIEGYVPDTTFTGDKLTTKYGDGGINSIYVNDEAMITEKDMTVINGVAHKLNKVLTIVTESLYDKIKQDESLTIFAEALEKTGWNNMLSDINEEEG